MKLTHGYIHSYLNHYNKIHCLSPFKKKKKKKKSLVWHLITIKEYPKKKKKIKEMHSCFVEWSVQTVPEVLLCSADTVSWIPPLKTNLYKLFLRKISKHCLAHIS